MGAIGLISLSLPLCVYLGSLFRVVAGQYGDWVSVGAMFFFQCQRPEFALIKVGAGTVPENREPALERTNTATPQNLTENQRGEAKEITKPDVKEDAYRQLIKKIDDQLKELRGRYATETRGNTGVDPFLFTTEEAFRGHQEDLLSRLRDAQYKAQGLPSGGEAQSPPFSTNPPPAYTEKQKLLSDLRKQITELESERRPPLNLCQSSRQPDDPSVMIDSTLHVHGQFCRLDDLDAMLRVTLELVEAARGNPAGVVLLSFEEGFVCKMVVELPLLRVRGLM